MAEAVLIPVEYNKVQDIINCLKLSDLLKPSSRLIQTPANTNLCSAIHKALHINILFHSDFSKASQISEEILKATDKIFIIPKKFIKSILLDSGQKLENVSFGTTLFVLSTQQASHATFLTLQDFPSCCPDPNPVSEEDLNNTLGTIKQELLDHSLRNSQLTVKHMEMAKTNLGLTSLILNDTKEKLEKIEDIIEENRQRKLPKNEKILKTTEKVQEFKQDIRKLADKVSELRLFVDQDSPDFSQVQVQDFCYNTGIVEWSHCRSENNSQHVFNIKNVSGRHLKNLNIYNSDDNESMALFDLNPYQEVEIICDLMIDQLKLLGKVIFYVYFCCFSLAKEIPVYCIEILSVDKLSSDSNRYTVNYQCNVTSLKGVQVMHNDVVIIKSLNTKNFESNKALINIKDFRGEVSIYFFKDGRAISNAFSLVV